jgi:hypothetical protein
MDEEITLTVSSIDSGYVFISGSWELGELRFDFDEVGMYVSPNNYNPIEGIDTNSICYSCRKSAENCDIDLFEIPLGVYSSSNPIICAECRESLIETLSEFIRDNPCDLSIHNL